LSHSLSVSTWMRIHENSWNLAIYFIIKHVFFFVLAKSFLDGFITFRNNLVLRKNLSLINAFFYRFTWLGIFFKGRLVFFKTWFIVFFAQNQSFSKIHKTNKNNLCQNKKYVSYKLNDCQLSMIFMNPRSIHVETLREWLRRLLLQLSIRNIHPTVPRYQVIKTT
jgi:hypothetical protein